MASPAGARAALSILVFHRVHARADPLFPDEPDAARFDRVLGWITSWFDVLALDDAVDRLKRGALPERAAAITFDDGYADNLVVAAPLLRKHGLHATFFVTTGFLDGGRMWNDTIIESVRGTRIGEVDGSFVGLPRLALATVEQKRAAIAQLIPAIKHLDSRRRDEAVARLAEACHTQLPPGAMLSARQVRELRGLGMGIGAHTVTHPILARLDEAAARREIAESRETLEALVGEPLRLFAYPNGKHGDDYDERHVGMVRSLGFAAAVTTNWGAARTGADPMELPRFTPWDAGRVRFGLRMLQNLRRRDGAVPSASPRPTSAQALPVQKAQDRSVRPRISVVVPCYNAERWIAATLRSVYAQGWPALEVIVVDDGSTDASAEIVAREFPQVLLLRQHNAGVAAARNAGIARASGEWIAFLDADDLWLPDKLDAQWESLVAHPEARMAYTAWQVWPGATAEPDAQWLAALRATEGDAKKWRGASGWIYAELLCDSHVWTSTVLVERALLDEVGAFDPALRIGEDLDLWLRASRVTPILRVARPLALYRAHPDSLTKAAPRENYQALVVERAITRWGFAPPHGTAARPADVSRALAMTWRDYAGAHLSRGSIKEARRGALKSIGHDWRRAAGWRLLARSTVLAGTVRGSTR